MYLRIVPLQRWMTAKEMCSILRSEKNLDILPRSLSHTLSTAERNNAGVVKRFILSGHGCEYKITNHDSLYNYCKGGRR